MDQSPIISSWHAPITRLDGIGSKLAESLSRLIGGSTLFDLVSHLPHRWIDRSLKTDFASTLIGETQTVSGIVQDFSVAPRGSKLQRIRLADDTGFLTLVFFNSNAGYLKRQFVPGSEMVVSGVIEDFHGQRQMTHPDYAVPISKMNSIPKVEPVYPLQAGLTNRRLHGFIRQAISELPDPGEWIADDILQKENWPSFMEALRTLHLPDELSHEFWDKPRARLAYDEALARALTFRQMREANRGSGAHGFPDGNAALRAFSEPLPYPMTNAQTRACEDIISDTSRTIPMQRMLQGDVGAGKTTVAAFSLFNAVKAGYQGAVMAPTEVLARQLFESIKGLLAPFDLQIECLTGRDKGKARQAILERVASGETQILCGTHALFQDGVEFDELALIVIDEQHRFGVGDRFRLASKAMAPHLLVMSATPIPRTLSMTVHGDIETSILDEKPAGRQPIDTRILPDSRIEDVFSGAGRALTRDERIFWVCPRVDNDGDMPSALGRYAMLKEFFGDAVGLVHGRLSAKDKEAALEAFRRGDTRILVATTVIEVGVDVPEATIMVIEAAESFGLAQLHQLRGRVGRGSKPSFCLLVYTPPLGETAKKRLQTLRDSDDGFYIAEVDFKLRGPGDILGSEQSGLPDFRFIDLSRHQGLMEMANNHAAYVFNRKPVDLSGFQPLMQLLWKSDLTQPQV